MQGQIGTIVVLSIAGMLLALVLGEARLMQMILGETRWLAVLAGGFIGALWAKVIVQGRRIDSLEKRLQGINDSSPFDSDESAETDPALSATGTESPQSEPAPPPAAEPAGPGKETRPAAQPTRRTSTRSIHTTDGLATRVRHWFSHGNVPVRIGVLVTFIAVAALLRYAGEQGWLSMPIEVRLSLVALAAIAGLVFAWTRRERQRVFSLSLQGGAIGVLLLTTYAAFDLYTLIPAVAALGLTLVFVAASGILAMTQKARALAVLGMLAGYAAPMLIAADGDRHLVLFAWYAILNLAVLALAWSQTWPLLNRLGFAFTFVVAWVWGVLAWSPEHYLVAQVFLVLFFLFYLAIPVIEALRRPEGQPERLDVMLVFGLPLFALPLQIAILEADRLPVAFSTLVGALSYLISAWLIRSRAGMTTLMRSHAALALGLATVAVPFAFSGPTITVIWALQGAALVWYGCRQQRRLVRLAGLALQLTAASVWLVNHMLNGRGEWFLVNPLGISGLALAFAALFSAWCFARASAHPGRVNVLAGWGLILWVLTGLFESATHFEAVILVQMLITWTALTVLLAATLHHAQRWWITAPVSVLALFVCIPLALAQSANTLPLSGWGAPVWLLVLAAGLYGDWSFRQHPAHWRVWIALASHSAIVTALALTGMHLADQSWSLGDGWQWLIGSLPLLALTAWLAGGRQPPLCPGGSLEPDQRAVFLAFTATMVSLGMVASLVAPGRADPMSWLALLNPLELGQLIAVMVLLMLARGTRSLSITFPLPVVGLLLAAIVTAMGLRAVHHLTGVAWDLEPLLASNTAQATLSVTWTLIGVSAWIAGSRMKSHALWWSGAILLAMVLLKLLIIDRQFLSTAAGILSFMAFGLLSIAVGYLAPAPPSNPRRESTP
jgi:uncharacterized membrane protein